MIGNDLLIPGSDLKYTVNTQAIGAGNLVAIIIQSTYVTECFTALGKKGFPAERVAEQAVNAVRSYLAAGVPIGRYLADQILLFMALAGCGSFMTVQPSLHTLTNIAVINSFMGLSIKSVQMGQDVWKIHCTR